MKGWRTQLSIIVAQVRCMHVFHDRLDLGYGMIECELCHTVGYDGNTELRQRKANNHPDMGG